MYQRLSMLALLVAFFGLLAPQSYGDDEPTPHSVIDRALKAGGGAEKIKQFKAVSFKAVWKSDSKFGPAEMDEMKGFFAGPTLFQVEFTNKKEKLEKLIYVGSGDVIWAKYGKEDPKDVAQESKQLAAWVTTCFYGVSLPDRLLALKGKDYKLKIVGDQAVNGVETVAMSVNHEPFPDATIFFDKATGFPVKSTVKAPTPSEDEPRLSDNMPDRIEFYFDDYKEFEGVRHFTKLRLRVVGHGEGECQLRDLKLHKTVDPGAFKKPG